MQFVSRPFSDAGLKGEFRSLFVLAIVVGMCPRGIAQAVPRLVKDLEAAPVEYQGEFRAVGDAVYLAGYKHATGYELWKSDGAPEGARLLKELNPGRVGSNPAEFTPVGQVVFFSAFQEPLEIGTELWRTDGTPEGTMLVKDINAGSSSEPRNFYAWNNQLVFSANDGQYGREPWISDGTPEGTRLLKDIAPGTGSSQLSEFTPLGRELYFLADADYASKPRIWKTDGTAGNTRVLSSKLFRSPKGLSSLGKFLYFAAIEKSSRTWKLWKTDGTATGTTKVTDMSLSGYEEPVVVRLGSRILFATDDGQTGCQLWSTKGSAATTVRIGNVGFLRYFEYNGTFTAPGQAGPSLYFSGYDAAHGVELWKTDGTAAGTGLLKDLSPGPGNSYPNSFRVVGESMYFRAGKNGDGDNRLWVTGGTSASTKLVKAMPHEIQMGNGSGNSLYFKTDDGSGKGIEIWKTSGSASSTVCLTDFMGTGDSYSFRLSRVDGGKLRFWARNRGGYDEKLYETDGTEEGTSELPDFGDDCLAGGTIYFQGFKEISSSRWDYELYKSDGTEAGTKLVKNISANDSSSPRDFNALGNLVCFTAEEGIHGRELWRSDGEASGTFMLKDLVPGKASSSPANFIKAGNVLFFTLPSDSVPDQLWRTDGTTAGTYMLTELEGMKGFRVLGDTLVFEVSSYFPTNEPTLWRSDGTLAGTFEISKSPLGTPPLQGGDYYALHSMSSNTAVDLWRSNGTADGTYKVSRQTGRISVYDPEVEPVGDSVSFCLVKDGRNELWMSDGTEAGTKKVELSGDQTSWINNQMTVENTLFFIAGANGDYRLWKSDGTPEGTGTVLLDIYKHGTIPFFWKAGENVYFPLETEEYGNELHVLPISELRIAKEAFADWAQDQGLASDQAAPRSSPHGDGVENLLKYAFFMDGAGADRHVMTPGGGIDGLPAVSTSMNPSGGRIVRVEFIRRKNSGLVYRPLFSKSLGHGSFVPMNGNQLVSGVDSVRERVVAEHAVEDQSQTGFGVVEVSME